jgi:hypothetical protein
MERRPLPERRLAKASGSEVPVVSPLHIWGWSGALDDVRALGE